MFENLKASAAQTARRSAFGLLGGLALVVGIAFLTVALWIVLVNVADSLTAALVIGSIYVGSALILLAFSLSGRSDPPTVRAHHRQAPPSKAEAMVGIAAAFFEGLGAGLTARPPQSGSGPPKDREN